MHLVEPADEARDLAVLLRKEAKEGWLDGRLISAFVQSWAADSEQGRAHRVRRGPRRGTRRDKAVTAAITHGLCVHYRHPVPDWVHRYRARSPCHPISDRNITSPLMRARIVITASPVCREHNVWFGESLVSARKDLPPPPRPPHWPKRYYRRKRINKSELSRSELLGLFRNLDSRLAADGRTETITVGGGTAMAFVADERFTKDLDVLDSHLDEELVEAVEEASTAIGMGGDRLDRAAAPYADLDIHGFSAITVVEGTHLTVRRPDDEHLLAMKLVAARDKDLQDAAVLARRLGVVDADGMHKIASNVYENWADMDEAVEWTHGYAEHVVDEIELQAQLEQAPPPGQSRTEHRRFRRGKRSAATASPSQRAARKQAPLKSRSVCGAWMPKAKRRCGRRAGHRSPCR